MPLSHPGAGYQSRNGIANPPETLKQFARHVLEAADDLASQVQAVAKQVNAPTSGSQSPPAAPTSLSVTASGGYALAIITNNHAPAGVEYLVQYSTSPQFINPIPEALGDQLTMHKYLAGLSLYFRCAAGFPTSALSPWTYFGTSASPTAVVV